jgi:hypothetical protein
MNMEIGAEAALFPEKEYISGIFVAVCAWNSGHLGSIWFLTEIKRDSTVRSQGTLDHSWQFSSRQFAKYSS